MLDIVLSYYVTKFTAGLQNGKLSSAGVEILMTFKIAPNKYIQVVKIGGKYFSYAVCKDTVTLLGELTKDDISELLSHCRTHNYICTWICLFNLL